MKTKISFSLLLLLAFFAAPVALFAQDDEDAPKSDCQTIDDAAAQKAFEKSKDRKKYDWNERKGFLEEAIAAQPTWAEANLALAKMYITKAKADGAEGQYPGAIKYLKAAVDNCPKIGAEPHYWLGTQYYLVENYKEAIIYLQKFIDYDTDDPKLLGANYEFNSGQALEMLRWSKFYVDIQKNVRPFAPTPVKGIDTPKDEYLAIITPDNTEALYIRRVPVNQTDRVWSSQLQAEVFTMSLMQPNGEFDKGTFMDDPFNKNPNEGAATLTIDNKHLFYTITKDAGDGPNTDIYTADLNDGSWTPIRSLGEKVNDPIYWDSQPTISGDGNILYFASNRPGGQGGIDIWMTKKGIDGEWGVPINLGPAINTQYNEKSPFIHSDSQTLYFSSDGHPGVGQYDIFYSRADANGKWKEPVNIGIPINTAGDDVGFFVSTDGTTGFFNSNASIPGQIGGYDVYQFELYPEARPEATVIVKGDLKDEFGNPLTGPTTVEIKNVQTKQKSFGVVDTITGSFAAAIKISKKEDYVITIKKDSAAFNSQLISGKQEFKTTVVVAEPMKIAKLKEGSAYTINDINFASNAAVLEPESMVVLELFAAYLKEHPTMKIEIRGHTDNVGDDGQNLDLSNERSYAVFEALTKFGVPRSQITSAKGYGETKPIADNATAEGRAKNRRTEFVLVRQ
jgi:outer membrane protein OmpA-like peptidoglycan-associated protein